MPKPEAHVDWDRPALLHSGIGFPSGFGVRRSGLRRGNAAASLLPGLIVLAAAAYLAVQMRMPSTDGDPLALLAMTPVSAEGRVKPMDTVARNALMVLSGKSELRHEGQTISAVQWLADAIARPEVARSYPVFRVDHPDVLTLIGSDPESGGRHRFSVDDLVPHFDKIAEQGRLAAQVKRGDRNAYQKHVFELWVHVNRFAELANLQTPFVVPPAGGHDWRPLPAVFAQGSADDDAPPAAQLLASAFAAYREQNLPAVGSALSQHLTMLTFERPVEMRKAKLEVFFNHFAPFYHGMVLYVLALVLGLASVMASGYRGSELGRGLWHAAVMVLALTLVLHTAALGARMWLQGRPPVTNLYSSAVFIGWCAVILGLVLEVYFRNALGTIAAALTGFATLIVAHHLAEGDTMQMMQAVLDSNFWLATHVVTITIGYSACFIAGAIGLAFICTGLFTPHLTRGTAQGMHRMMYGVVAFALLFSFVGTVLGGIWADQSWGRFWGWDPKENGAVLIVLMNAVILHARWAGMIHARGVAVLCVAGNIVTAWSWFGTNMLGIGLHSYGFMDSAVFWMLAFVGSQLLFIALGCVPTRLWTSYNAPDPVPLDNAAAAPTLAV